MLDRQVASSAVGDRAQAIVETLDGVLLGGARAQPVEDAADLEAVLFARGALPARLDSKEA